MAFTHLKVNTHGAAIDADHHETQLEQVSDASVTITAADDEIALLEALRRIVFDRFDRDISLVILT